MLLVFFFFNPPIICYCFPSVQPTGENGATRAPISIDLERDSSLSSKSIAMQFDSRRQPVAASEASY